MASYLIYNHCSVTEDVRYREANGRVKPDAIPTAIFPNLSETRAESACNTPLMASRLGSLV